MKLRNPFRRRKAPSDPLADVRAQGLSRDEMAELLRCEPEALEAFEQAYAYASMAEPRDEHDLFGVNSREASAALRGRALETETPKDLDVLVGRIVDELMAQTEVMEYDGDACGRVDEKQPVRGFIGDAVTLDDVSALPEHLRPQLTGELVKKDIDADSAPVLLWYYRRMLEARREGDVERARTCYHHFRQGLDILDLDPLTYEIIATNPNSMGHWLPALAKAAACVDGLSIPRTRIARVPLPILQLTRCEYMGLTPTTLRIVDEWARRAFGLEPDGDYFIKTGTFSSKFDFRNCRVRSPKEVSELGEYLLFIHHQALQAAGPLSRPCVYGMSTTVEWVVRDFIDDGGERPTIYHGLPLRCEYRVFIDCDSDRVLGVHPYWDPDVMHERFDGARDIDGKHDAVTYRLAEDALATDFEANEGRVAELVARMLPHLDLAGQWSLDVMQNGDDLWLIDMALAENSAFYNETVPPALRRPSEEDWLPRITDGE